MTKETTLENAGYRLQVRIEGSKVHLVVQDRKTGRRVSDGPYLYRITAPSNGGWTTFEGLSRPEIVCQEAAVVVTGQLGSLRVDHLFRLPADADFLDETLTLVHAGTADFQISDARFGVLLRVTDSLGKILPPWADDRFVAIPFRHKPNDLKDVDNDFAITDFLLQSGREYRIFPHPGVGAFFPTTGKSSEGWAWLQGDHTLTVFKFNQDAIELSVMSTERCDDGLQLCFGGAAVLAGEPSALRRLQPGQSIRLGMTRLQTVAGNYVQAYYTFRDFLDSQGCGCPADWDPPVHWNELYDNPDWNIHSSGRYNTTHPESRRLFYTRELLLEEARKAVEYHCQALYLDPGWDVAFGSFIWGEEWLGPQAEFSRQLREEFDLSLSLHCPMASWTSNGVGAVHLWPRESWRRDRSGQVIENWMCPGSHQYLDEAEKRLLQCCAEGATFLMFDGNWYPGECWDSSHGHPIPYSVEDHCQANLDLARRVHARFPKVKIEMHDMANAGSMPPCVPVYYGYGTGAHDEAWGFELMWEPMEDIRSGRSRSLYYYNLACNIPLYLHIDLRDDNENCLLVWWYASTCRHLGIGGTHPNPIIADAQKRHMATYRRLERFFKRGEFLGFGEEIHIHLLRQEKAFVVNLFNLSDEDRLIAANIPMSRLGLDASHWFFTPKGGFVDWEGNLVLRRRLPAWGAEVLHFYQVGETTVTGETS